MKPKWQYLAATRRWSSTTTARNHSALLLLWNTPTGRGGGGDHSLRAGGAMEMASSPVPVLSITRRQTWLSRPFFSPSRRVSELISLLRPGHNSWRRSPDAAPVMNCSRKRSRRGSTVPSKTEAETKTWWREFPIFPRPKWASQSARNEINCSRRKTRGAKKNVPATQHSPDSAAAYRESSC